MKATPLPALYRAAGFVSPQMRRQAAEYREKFKQTFDERHPLHGIYVTQGRLRSRRNFLKVVDEEPPENYPLRQENPGGVDLDWRTWQTLNRIRTGVAAVKTNKIRWNQIDHQDAFCDCGEIQDMAHLMNCRNCPNTCSLDDLWNAEQNAIDVAQYWAQKL